MKILMIISAFNLRIDYSDIQFVIYQRQNRSLINFNQESNQENWDEKKAYSIIFTSKKMK